MIKNNKTNQNCISIFLVTAIFCGCCIANKQHKRGLYVRIVNISAVRTDGYKIGQYSFSGLKPNDTSDYQFVTKFNWGNQLCAILDSITICSNIYDCRACDVDSPKFLTVKVGISDIEKKVPKVFYVDQFSESKTVR